MLSKLVLILLLLLVGLLACESQELDQHDLDNSTQGPLSQAQFKDFMLVMTWPASFCKSQRCAQKPDKFTVHGLWPQNTKRRGKGQLTNAILDPRKTALLTYWPDLSTNDFQASKKFWRSEYNKHGLFCTTKYSPEQYVVKILTLGEGFKPRGWLAKNGIVPAANKQYDSKAILAAIKSQTSVDPDLQCVTVKGKSYLLEVRLCLDDKLEKFINCGGKIGQCATHVYYPSAPALNQDSDEIIEEVEDLVNLYEVV